MTASRPVPVADELSTPFWAAAAAHVLTLARCGRCSACTLPPDVTCPRCGGTDPAWTFEPVAGGGVVRSWTVVRQSFLPGLADDVPFTLVDVELDEHPDVRLIGRLVDADGAALTIGARVEVAFEDVADGVALPAFRAVP